MDLQRALYLISMSEKFQRVRIKIRPATDFTKKVVVMVKILTCLINAAW